MQLLTNCTSLPGTVVLLGFGATLPRALLSEWSPLDFPQQAAASGLLDSHGADPPPALVAPSTLREGLETAVTYERMCIYIYIYIYIYICIYLWYATPPIDPWIFGC